MIEDDDVVEEEKLRVGNVEVIALRIGNAFAPRRGAITEVADRAAEERRERRFVVDTQRHELFAQLRDRIGCAAIESQIAAGIEADEGVAPEVFAAFDAFEEEGFGVGRRERRECRERCDGVGAQFAHDRNDVVVLS